MPVRGDLRCREYRHVIRRRRQRKQQLLFVGSELLGRSLRGRAVHSQPRGGAAPCLGAALRIGEISECFAAEEVFAHVLHGSFDPRLVLRTHTGRVGAEPAGLGTPPASCWPPTWTLGAIVERVRPRRPRLTASVPNVQGVAHPDYLVFSDDGRLLLTAGAEDKRLTAIDMSTHHVTWSLIVPDFSVRQVAFSPDGKTIAVNSGDATKGQVTIYDAATGKKRRSLSTRSYGGVAYLHDGKWLVVTSGSTKSDTQLYNSATLQPIGVPYPTQRTLDISPQTSGEIFGDPIAVNGRGTMFSRAEFDAPLLWDADPAHWLAIACRIASRNMTKAEWHEYLPSRSYEASQPASPRRGWRSGPHGQLPVQRPPPVVELELVGGEK